MKSADLSSFEFHPSGIFYPYVGSFLVALAGLPSIINPTNPLDWGPDDRITLQGVRTGARDIHPYQIHREVIEQALPHDYYCTHLCIMLANTAYESVKHLNDGGPLFEFMRHVRNAGSHRNRFNFYPQEPARPAAWRGAKIDDSLKGMANPLHGSVCFGQYLGFVDILEILWDLEQTMLPRLVP